MEQLSHVNTVPRFLPVLVMLPFPPCARVLSSALPATSSVVIGIEVVIGKVCCCVPFAAGTMEV